MENKKQSGCSFGLLYRNEKKSSYKKNETNEFNFNLQKQIQYPIPFYSYEQMHTGIL